MYSQLLKKMPGCLFSLAFFFRFTALLSAQELIYYVAPTGNNTNDGTVESPWLTIQYAIDYSSLHRKDSLQPIKIVLRGGDYFLDSAIRIENIQHLSLVAAKGENPVLQGLEAVSEWQLVTHNKDLNQLPKESLGKVWQASLNREVTLVGEKNRMDVYYKGSRLHLARWPNQSYTFSGKTRGVQPPLEVKNYRNYKGCAEGVFEYRNSRINTWCNEKEIFLHGYWFWDWAEEYKKVKSVDSLQCIITLELPHHHYGYRDELKFYGMNILSELDTIGEFYVDNEKKVICFYPPANFDPSQVTVSNYNADEMIHFENSSQVLVKGLSLQGGQNGAISIYKCSDLSIEDCKIVQFGNDAITIEASKQCFIKGCLLDQLGHGGIVALGGDRITLTHADYFVENTVISNFSLYKPTYEPAILFEGAGMTIRHCLFFNAPSTALRLDGNDILVEYNKFENLVTESDDQGALDAWFDITYRGVVIRYNYWRNITGSSFQGATAIRLDDLISGFIVYGNIFENCGGGRFGAVQMNGGKDNQIINNVMFHCHKLYSTSLWDDQRWKDVVASDRVTRQIIDFDFPSSLYKDHYPELRSDSALLPPPNHNFILRNISVNPDILISEEKQCVLEDNVEILKSKKSLKYYLQPIRLKKLGLTPIPFKKIGIQYNEYYLMNGSGSGRVVR